MASIISQWIEERLGIIIHKIHDEFGNITKDGYLLCRLLNNYGIITSDDLAQVKKSQNQQKCLGNFNIIKHWLRKVEVSLSDEEISEIINGNGVVSINLFYKLYLTLNDKSNINFTSKQAFQEHELPNKSSKFKIEKIVEDKTHFPKKKKNLMFEENFDIIQWHRDRVDMMLKKCKSVREDYVHVVKNRERRKSSVSFNVELPNISSQSKEEKSSVSSLDSSFEKLLSEKKKAKNMKKFVPCAAESKKILKNFKNKHKSREAEIIMKRELYKKILAELWQRVKEEEKEEFDRTIIQNLLNHSYYEKQMIRKLQEVKVHKESIMTSKQIIANNINKEKEKEFTKKLFGVDADTKSEELQYYFEKERSIALHKKIYEQKLKLRSEKCHKMCREIVQQICNYAMTESEYVSYYGELPRQSIIDSWKQLFVAGIPLDANSIAPENLIQPPENEEIESVIQVELERQDRIDKQDFQNYLNYEAPWQLESISVDDDFLYDMKCGLNIIGHVVQNILEIKYPLPPAPPAPNLPKMEIAVCLNGLHDISCLQPLKMLLKCKNYEIIEIQEVINFCVNAYREEMTMDTVETYDADEVKSVGSLKTKKGKKTRYKPTQEKSVPEFDLTHRSLNEKAEKKVQTPKYFPWEEILLSPQAELGKIAEEELARGQSLTNFLLVAMLVEYLKSKPNMKGLKYFLNCLYWRFLYDFPGWVLLNFPINMQQSMLLEQALCAKQISDEIQTLSSLTEIIDGDMDVKDNNQNLDMRQSRILQFPVVRKESNKYTTILTAYIQLNNEEGRYKNNIYHIFFHILPNILIKYDFIYK